MKWLLHVHTPYPNLDKREEFSSVFLEKQILKSATLCCETTIPRVQFAGSASHRLVTGSATYTPDRKPLHLFIFFGKSLDWIPLISTYRKSSGRIGSYRKTITTTKVSAEKKFLKANGQPGTTRISLPHRFTLRPERHNDEKSVTDTAEKSQKAKTASSSGCQLMKSDPLKIKSE